jgi:hypothetical protein
VIDRIGGQGVNRTPDTRIFSLRVETSGDVFQPVTGASVVQFAVRCRTMQSSITQISRRAFAAAKAAALDGLRKAKYEDLLSEYPSISYVAGRAWFTGNGK